LWIDILRIKIFLQIKTHFNLCKLVTNFLATKFLERTLSCPSLKLSKLNICWTKNVHVLILHSSCSDVLVWPIQLLWHRELVLLQTQFNDKHIYNNDGLRKRTLMMVGMNFVGNGNGIHNDQIEIYFFLTLLAST
jgi:hypothetical protein